MFEIYIYIFYFEDQLFKYHDVRITWILIFFKYKFNEKYQLLSLANLLHNIADKVRVLHLSG